MDETWIINDSSPEDVMAWLGELAEYAKRKQSEDAQRPQARILDGGGIDVLKLPLPVRSRALHAGGIYAKPAGPGRPFGRLHLLVLVEETQERVLRIEIAGDPGFALRSDEIRAHFRHRFPRHVRGAAGRRTGLLLRINQEMASDHTGAPVLACNVWLEEQLVLLKDSSEKHTLFRPWLDRYRALRGIDPADPARSFRAAVTGCERRLHRRGLHIRTAHNTPMPKHRGTQPQRGSGHGRGHNQPGRTTEQVERDLEMRQRTLG